MLKKSNDLNSYVLSEIIDRVPHYIFWKNADLIFMGCNKIFAEQFGYKSSEDIIGKTDSDFSWPDDLRNKYADDDIEITNGKTKIKL